MKEEKSPIYILTYISKENNMVVYSNYLYDVIVKS